MNYVAGFVVPVPRKNLPAYRRLSQKAGKVWREYGAIDYRNVLATTSSGKAHFIPTERQLKPSEVVVFSWITYKSRAQRDRVNAKVMKDPRLADMMDPKSLPFDAKRMFFGGFKIFVEV